MQTLVSIIIPTFNRAQTLKKAIDSVLLQTYEFWELIIVDNSSTDNTISIIKDYENEKIKIINVVNKGVIAHSRNIGVKNSNGKFIAFLDSDDWWESEKLENAIESLDNENADIVYHDCKLVSLKSNSLTKCRRLSNNVLADLVTNGNTLVTSSVVASKKKINALGGFDEAIELIGWEDYHLWLKLARNSSKFFKLKGVLGSCWEGIDNFDNPNRVLVNLVEIEKYFMSEFSDRFNLEEIWWLDYTRGRAYLKTGNVIEAKKSLNIVLFSGSPLIYKLKSLYFLLVILPFNRP